MCIVTTTSTVRPELLARTFESFRKNLKGLPWELKINLDYTPATEEKDLHECVVICWQYFDNVEYNVEYEGNFPRAIKWLWNTPADWVFHLEDDWLLNFPIEWDELKRNCAVQVSLRSYSRLYDGNFMLCPSLIRGRVCREISQILTTNRNPEQQIREMKWNGHTVIYPEVQDKVVVQDIGREWLETKGLSKGRENLFVSYEKGEPLPQTNQAEQAKASLLKYGGSDGTQRN